MKTIFNNSRYLILIGLIALSSQAFGQVITRVIPADDKIENYIPWYNPHLEIPIVNAPFVDVEAVLLEDELTGREMPRIGIRQDVSYTMEDGGVTRHGNYSLWSMTLRSENAKSMSIRFDDTYLPENAIMYLFNKESGFIVGPIGKSNFRNGAFRSDYINGDHVDILIFFLINEFNKGFSMNISSYDHGISAFKQYDPDFETSGDCNINIACESGWDCQSNAVCKIIHSTIGSCSGVLVNNDCCDATPYILTANHCTTGRPVEDFLFRFNYQSPQCDPNEETHPSMWIVLFGSDLRANWVGTDFALLELESELSPKNSFSFAGWDRISTFTQNSTCIHHPSGDVKKISFDYDANTIVGNYHRVIWDDGTTEPGSSGSPLFRSNKRIIGQLSGGPASCLNSSGWDDFGRFDVSWDGNGTLDSRLRDWLGSSTNRMTLDCMEHPIIDGPDILCNEPKVFNLINNMPCIKDVEWKVTPPNLFNSPTNGIGNTANLIGNPNINGSATITFTLTSDGCDPILIEKDFWVGKPQAFTAYPDPVICLGQFEQFIIPESPGAQTYHLQSSSPFLWISTHSPTPYVPIDIFGSQTGIFPLQLIVTNDCGSSMATIFVEVRRCKGDDGGFEPISQYKNNQIVRSSYDVGISPNPTNDYFDVLISGNEKGSEVKVSLISTDGRLLKSKEEQSQSFNINISDLPAGIYILKLNINGLDLHKKIVKL